jgi:hypothetical protein
VLDINYFFLTFKYLYCDYRKIVKELYGILRLDIVIRAVCPILQIILNEMPCVVDTTVKVVAEMQNVQLK